MLVGSPLMPLRLLFPRRDLEHAKSDRAILFDQTRLLDWVEFIHAAPFRSVEILSSLPRTIPVAQQSSLREKSRSDFQFPSVHPFLLFQLLQSNLFC